ncbi:MAG: hypothetical protein QOJ86_4151 [Bradyrhizobium sp.]|jgi:hypothetical protein|nr:hypothetical protein [Bradyrhizobium sp.]
MTIPQDRWAELSAAFASYLVSSRDERFQPGRLAEMIAREFRAYIGLQKNDKRVLLYRYTPSHDARYDEFDAVSSGWGAVSVTPDGRWTFGMSVELEPAPNGSPKSHVRWTMSFDMKEPVEVEIGLTLERLPLVHDGQRWITDPIIEAIYKGLRSGLAGNVSNSRRFGFTLQA